ncbi:hypothetical protein [Mucilaginibacter xinganensis]|uniref:Collagen-like protein n=1 Tax=Mucilaginibacter xinganensis TaxID=1234841 RepID=A0A223NT96_9SPHI|nr:hypothetical protein [Mucilaginibacter xinganensis]ASU33112.1 collagen-like protein [Mucilaginibacter xinganensis]
MKKIRYLFTAVMLLASCIKGGNVGPAGPAGGTGQVGPQGNTGPAGATGAAGSQGSTGSAGATGAQGATNAYYSDWITPATSTSDFDPNYLISWYQWDVPAPAITQDVIDKGLVLVYGTNFEKFVAKIGLTTNWPAGKVTAFPAFISITIENGTFDDRLSVTLQPGHIILQVTAFVGFLGGVDVGNTVSIKYTVVPGNTHSIGSTFKRR